MMINIELYLKTKNTETHITSMSNVHNPFKMGDIVHLSVSEEEPRKYSQFNNAEMVVKLKDQHQREKELFHLKDIEIFEENKYLDIEENKITIEYFCRFVD